MNTPESGCIAYTPGGMPTGVRHGPLQERLEQLGALLDGWIRDEMSGLVQAPAERFGAMLEYHLGWRDLDLQRLATTASPGKRLRPASALLVSEAVCGAIEPARTVAVAVELIHNFSLVHDDIQDRGELRRHRPTVWKAWGPAQGINVGDALFSAAQLAVLRGGGERAARLATVLNEACLRLVEGQYLDIELQEGRVAPTLETYEAMIARKTGALFESACRLGALAAGASEHVQEAYATYGRQLGIAFQEQDDILGVWGEPEVTGKPLAADVVERKRGLPVVLALGRADAPGWLAEYFAGQGEQDEGESMVRQVIEHLDAVSVRAAAETRIQQRYARACAALADAAGREPARTYLADICDLLLSRPA